MYDVHIFSGAALHPRLNPRSLKSTVRGESSGEEKKERPASASVRTVGGSGADVYVCECVSQIIDSQERNMRL